ncbi:MAG: (Fe-S)-binding protein [Chloroflexota bacterium]
MKKKQFLKPPRRIALFVTCMVDMMYPNVGMATVELLERFGIEVLFPDEQTCCGQPAFNAGYRDDARLLARRFIDIFEPLLRSGSVDAVVAPSGSCTAMTTHFYPLLFEEIQHRDPSASTALRRALSLAEATFELTEFLVDGLGLEDVNAHFPGKVTYHSCCHLLRESHIDRQPRTLLENVQDAEVVELEGSTECCGFGGLFSIKNAGISTAMGQRKTRNLAGCGADVAAMCDVSCMTHINGLLEKQSQRCRAVHIAEVLNHQVALDDKEGESATIQRQDPVEQPQPGHGIQTDTDSERVKPRRWQDI